jgi:murein DD-endopeptidase MepM/ murein hydrolase activator NlpD
MKQTSLVGAGLGLTAVLILAVGTYRSSRQSPPSRSDSQADEIRQPIDTLRADSGRTAMVLTAPLPRAAERVNKKPFGLQVSPSSSPVYPERFSGYHTGADFEVFADETEKDVAVRAVCGGVVLARKYSGGYGGVLVTSGQIHDESITVVYGHLRLSSISAQPGDSVHAGQFIGLLGDGYSDETDGERKHLHLSIHKGPETNIRGYVRSPSSLKDWVNPLTVISNLSQW